MGYCMSMAGCNFNVKAENVSKVENLLEDFCFCAETDADGNIIDLDFTGEKLWDHEKMCEQIAPFVEDGSYIEMHGEDGAMWRWVFQNGAFHEIEANITWPEVP